MLVDVCCRLASADFFAHRLLDSASGAWRAGALHARDCALRAAMAATLIRRSRLNRSQESALAIRQTTANMQICGGKFTGAQWRRTMRLIPSPIELSMVLFQLSLSRDKALP